MDILYPEYAGFENSYVYKLNVTDFTIFDNPEYIYIKDDKFIVNWS